MTPPCLDPSPHLEMSVDTPCSRVAVQLNRWRDAVREMRKVLDPRCELVNHRVGQGCAFDLIISLEFAMVEAACVQGSFILGWRRVVAVTRRGGCSAGRAWPAR